jgi:benzoylformate decarboxylase
MRASKAFVEQAKRLGIRRVYGNPGSTEMPLLREVVEGNLNYILSLHDGISVAMAEGEFLYSGKPTLVNLHTVNGLGNSIAYIYTALKDRSSIVITAGQQDTRHIFHDPILYADIKRIAEPVVKLSLEPYNAEDLPKYLIRAYKVSLTPPFGPVFLSLPQNFMNEEIEEGFSEDFSIRVNMGARDGEVELVAKEINESRNPAIIAGFEVDVFNAHDELVQLAEKLNCPVFAEPRASRAPFDSSHNLFYGTLQPSISSINSSLLDNDLILIIGASIVLYPYEKGKLLYGKEVIELTSDPEEAGKRVWKTFLCDLGEFLRKLNQMVKKREKRGRRNKKEESEGEIQRALRAILKSSGQRAIFDEVTSLTQEIRQYIGYKPGKYFSNIARTSHLGWALPSSIGYSIAGGKALAIIGDGSFNFSPQSLWTARKYNVDVKVIVIDNKGYGILRNYAKGNYEEVVNADFINPVTDIEKISEAYGVESLSTDLKGVQKGIDWMFKDSEVKLLRIEIEKEIKKLL